MKVQKTTDGKYAIVEETRVNARLNIWSAIDERRFDTEESAKNAMYGIHKPEPPKPMVVVDNRNLPKREDLRVTKLDKKVFVVELRRGGVWNEAKTFKTKTKADEWCAVNSK